MAPQAWFIGPVCGVDNCRSRRYVTRDGLTICQLGHVSEGNIEVNNEEEEMGGPITRRLNMVNVDSHGSYMSQTRSQSQGISTSKSQKLHGKDGFHLYMQCLQILLKKEYEVVISLFFSEECPDLLLIVKTNWIKIMTNAFKDYEKRHNYNENDEVISRRIPNLLDILAILYLSILQLRYKPVYLSQFHAKITTNSIPYAKTLHLIPENLLTKLLTVYHMLLQPSKILLPGDFDLSIRNIAGLLYSGDSLSIPVDYYYPYILTTFSDTLIMPQALDLFNLTIELVHKLNYTPTLIFNKTTTKDIPGSRQFPEIYLSSIIIFTIKTNFLFKITKSKKVNPQSWLHHFETFESSNINFTDLSDQDLLNWSDEQTEDYFNWIHQEIVPKKFHTSNGFDDKLTTMEKQLFRIFDYDTELSSIPQDRLVNPAPTVEKISEQGTILNMIKPTEKLKITPGLIRQVECKIISKLGQTLGVEPELLLASYQQVEKDIRDTLILEKPINGSLA